MLFSLERGPGNNHTILEGIRQIARATQDYCRGSPRMEHNSSLDRRITHVSNIAILWVLPISAELSSHALVWTAFLERVAFEIFSPPGSRCSITVLTSQTEESQKFRSLGVTRHLNSSPPG